MADVAQTLEDEGVASFAKSFDELMQSLTDKANALAAGRDAGPLDRDGPDMIGDGTTVDA